MNQKLNCILLVDDDEPTNFVNQTIIEMAGVTKDIAVVENGQEALDYLKTLPGETYPYPDLIILDINMPVMNGWEFLEEYQKLSEEQRAHYCGNAHHLHELR